MSNDLRKPFGETMTATSATVNAITKFVNDAHLTASRQVVEFAQRKKGWFERFASRIAPSQLERIVGDHEVRTAKSVCEFQLRVTELAGEAKYLACREAADAWLKDVQQGIRLNSLARTTEHMQALRNLIETRRLAFNAHIRERYKTLEGMADMPKIHAKYTVSIDNEIDTHLDWLDRQLEDFKAISEQRLGIQQPVGASS